jgi:hypothetical protein
MIAKSYETQVAFSLRFVSRTTKQSGAHLLFFSDNAVIYLFNMVRDAHFVFYPTFMHIPGDFCVRCKAAHI